MTSDIARKAVTANDIFNGSVIVHSRNTETNKLPPKVNKVTPVEQLESRYTDRWDDVRYYTGDSSG